MDTVPPLIETARNLRTKRSTIDVAGRVTDASRVVELSINGIPVPLPDLNTAEVDGVIEGQALFSALRRKVVVNAEQTPEYVDVRNAGHDGGDFLFVRRR